MKALLLVDIQNDFLPGGALPVPDGDQVAPVANLLMPHFDFVIATQDWHPANHASFADNHAQKKPGDRIILSGLSQILWPRHCVQNTPGAQLAAGLQLDRIQKTVQKGTDAAIDSYSGFFDNGHRRRTGLQDVLAGQGVTNLYVLGLATDYCVKFTVLDACALGYRVFVVVDGCRGVNLAPGDAAAALEEMRRAGAAVVVQSGQVAGGGH